MGPADFVYSTATEPRGPVPRVSIFVDRAQLRDRMRHDVVEAGLTVLECEPLHTVLEGAPRAIGEIVLLDCPRADAAVLAALAQLDARAARSGAHVVISTNVAVLEEVFACCDQSAPEILVDPTRAERALALGRALAATSNLRLREDSEVDRLSLLRLTEQVRQLARRIERSGMAPADIQGDGKVRRLECPRDVGDGPAAGQGLEPTRRAELPDPRLLRRVIRHRQLRARFVVGQLFADPAWDILLDLAVARAEQARVSVTSLCIASGVPPTTALRWIGQMTDAGLLERVKDDSDRRRVFIALTDGAAQAVARYFEEVGADAALTV